MHLYHTHTHLCVYTWITVIHCSCKHVQLQNATRHDPLRGKTRMVWDRFAATFRSIGRQRKWKLISLPPQKMVGQEKPAKNSSTVGGFIFFWIHPYLGKIPILTNIFQLGWHHHLVMNLEEWNHFHGPGNSCSRRGPSGLDWLSSDPSWIQILQDNDVSLYTYIYIYIYDIHVLYLNIMDSWGMYIIDIYPCPYLMCHSMM